ncbi:hypothetical protein ACJ41O_004867 [Fusarium nematophilum]
MAQNKKGSPAPRGAKNARGSRGGGRGGQGAPRGRGRTTPTPARINFIKDDTAGFTLADEARHTSQHDHSIWANNNNLRQRPVTFVSAGPSEPLKLLDVLLDQARNEPEEFTPTVSPLASPPSSTLEAGHQHESEGNEAENDREEDNRGDDIIGPDELEQAIQAQAVPVAAGDDTPDEPSFFFDLKGDQVQEKSHQDPVKIPERPSSRSSTSSEEVILFKGRGAQRRTQPAAEISMTQMQTEIRVVEEAIVAETARTSAPTPAPAPELIMEPSSTKKLSKKEKKATRRNRGNATSGAEDEEEAVLADYIANMKENSEVDEYFRELIQGGEDTAGIDGKTSPFPSSKARNPTVADTGESGEEDQDEDSDDDAPSTIDDETLARLIAGHDLGMEDVNFGDSSSDPDSSDDENPKKKPQGQNFNDDDDFDLMDWNRPSLRRRKGKGARAQINFNVSDSEMEAALQAAWKNDRLKKSERRKQREEQRALGMLGKKANPEDLRVKYPDGMNMDQVAEELRTFLLGSDDQLVFPPMDNHARKIIHELANKFKVKSKSTGKGDQRRPTLYRTGRTLPYIEATFDQAIIRVNRRYLPRLDMKGKKSNRLPPVRGGTSVAAATYRDGEIVGGSAPELGVENRGRAMLEKMGWSSGTALGATHNKGILQPVTHAMKKSKAGLG